MPNPENVLKHQYKKGQSGNLKGRPKGTLSIKTLIEKVWSEELTEKDAEGNPKIKALLSVKAMIDKAEKGDVSAFKALAERLEGLPKQEIEQNLRVTSMGRILKDGKDLNVEVG